MARIRTIKPEFWRSEQVTDCSPIARLLFIGLWNHCDDRGVHPIKPKTIKASIFPADDFSSTDIQRLLDELASNSLIGYFDGDDGQQYLWVTGWKTHQRVDRPNPKYPKPPAELDKSAQLSLPIRRGLDDPSPPEGKGREGSRREGRGEEGGSSNASPNPGPAGQDDQSKPSPGVAIIEGFDAARVKHFGPAQARPYPNATDLVTAQRWIEAGATPELCGSVFDAVFARVKHRGARPLNALRALDGDVADAIQAAKQPMAAANPNSPAGAAAARPDPELLAQQRNRNVERFKSGAPWHHGFGPAPNEPGCLADPAVLAKHGYRT